MMVRELVIGRILLLIVLFIVIPIGAIFLQIYLSKREERWLGLILPMIPFALSLIVVFSMAAYIGPGTSTLIDMIDGEPITTIIGEGGAPEAIPGAVAGAIVTFVMMNIPTAILLVIYKVMRGRIKGSREVEKMSVQDL